MLVKVCLICKKALSDDENSLRFDCGGDCIECMALYALDPECIERVNDIYIDMFFEEVRIAAEHAKKKIRALSHDDPVEAEYSAVARMQEGLRVW